MRQHVDDGGVGCDPRIAEDEIREDSVNGRVPLDIWVVLIVVDYKRDGSRGKCFCGATGEVERVGGCWDGEFDVGDAVAFLVGFVVADYGYAEAWDGEVVQE